MAEAKKRGAKKKNYEVEYWTGNAEVSAGRLKQATDKVSVAGDAIARKGGK